MPSRLCFGIYDANCDGATEEQPVKIIKAPGLDMTEVKESSVGSCVQRLMSGHAVAQQVLGVLLL